MAAFEEPTTTAKCNTTKTTQNNDARLFLHVVLVDERIRSDVGEEKPETATKKPGMSPLSSLTWVIECELVAVGDPRDR